MSSIVDATLVFLGAAAVLMMGAWTALYDAATVTDRQDPTKEEVFAGEHSLPKAA